MMNRMFGNCRGPAEPARAPAPISASIRVPSCIRVSPNAFRDRKWHKSRMPTNRQSDWAIFKPIRRLNGSDWTPQQVRRGKRYSQDVRLFFVLVLAMPLCAASDPSQTESELAVRVPNPPRRCRPGRTCERPANTDWGRIAAGARDIAYDRFRRLIYAGTADGQHRVPGAVPAHPNSVLVIDPGTRDIVQVIPCGSAPYRLALSARGKYLWVALDHDQAIQRINLETHKIEFTITFADIFADVPGAGVAFTFGARLYQVTAMQPDLVDDEIVAVASAQAPLFVLRGNFRPPRLGRPEVGSIVPNADGSFWTESYRFRISGNGVEVLEKPSEVVPPLLAPFADAVIDEVNVIRRASDLRRVGMLNRTSISAAFANIVYREDTGRGYIGDGRFGYSIAALDPKRLVVTDYWHVEIKDDGAGAGPGRLIDIGSEGFAVVFGEPWDGTTGTYGKGGDILFVPLDCLRPVDSFPLPEPQPASGGIRYFPVPVQGATVDRSSGRVLFSVASYVPGLGNSILPFSPDDGRFGAPVSAGSEPYVGTVPADGRFYYLSLAGSRTVKRFKLPDLVEDPDFGIYDWAFGWTTSGGVPTNVNVLEVPGALSTTIAIQRMGGLGTAMFDNGVERIKRGGRDSVQFSPSGQWLFALGNTTSDFPFARLAVTPHGLEPEATQAGLVDFNGGFGTLLRCTDKLCVTSNGMVLDPFQMQRVRVLDDGPFGTSQTMSSQRMLALDANMDRAYFYLPTGTPMHPICGAAFIHMQYPLARGPAP